MSDIEFSVITSDVMKSFDCTFVEIDHESFFSAILLFPLIQEGLLSVTSESMCTKHWLTAGDKNSTCPLVITSEI